MITITTYRRLSCLNFGILKPMRNGYSNENEGITWDTFEYDYTHNPLQWYGILFLASGILIAISVMSNNILLAGFLLVASFLLVAFSRRKPELVRVTVTKRGIRKEQELYPYIDIDHFFILEEGDATPLLLIERRSGIQRVLSIPISRDVDTEILKEVLSEHIPETHMRRPGVDILVDRLGY